MEIRGGLTLLLVIGALGYAAAFSIPTGPDGDQSSVNCDNGEVKITSSHTSSSHQESESSSSYTANSSDRDGNGLERSERNEYQSHEKSEDDKKVRDTKTITIGKDGTNVQQDKQSKEHHKRLEEEREATYKSEKSGDGTNSHSSQSSNEQGRKRESEETREENESSGFSLGKDGVNKKKKEKSTSVHKKQSESSYKKSHQESKDVERRDGKTIHRTARSDSDEASQKQEESQTNTHTVSEEQNQNSGDRGQGNDQEDSGSGSNNVQITKEIIKSVYKNDNGVITSGDKETDINTVNGKTSEVDKGEVETPSGEFKFDGDAPPALGKDEETNNVLEKLYGGDISDGGLGLRRKRHATNVGYENGGSYEHGRITSENQESGGYQLYHGKQQATQGNYEYNRGNQELIQKNSNYEHSNTNRGSFNSGNQKIASNNNGESIRYNNDQLGNVNYERSQGNQESGQSYRTGSNEQHGYSNGNYRSGNANYKRTGNQHYRNGNVNGAENNNPQTMQYGRTYENRESNSNYRFGSGNEQHEYSNENYRNGNTNQNYRNINRGENNNGRRVHVNKLRTQEGDQGSYRTGIDNANQRNYRTSNVNNEAVNTGNQHYRIVHGEQNNGGTVRSNNENQSRQSQYRSGNYKSGTVNNGLRGGNNSYKRIYESNSGRENRNYGFNGYRGVENVVQYRPGNLNYAKSQKHKNTYEYLQSKGRRVNNRRYQGSYTTARANAGNYRGYNNRQYTQGRTYSRNSGRVIRYGSNNNKIRRVSGGVDLHKISENTHYCTGNGRYKFIPGQDENSHRYYDHVTKHYLNTQYVTLRGGKRVIIPGNYAEYDKKGCSKEDAHKYYGNGYHLGNGVYYLGHNYRYGNKIIVPEKITKFLKNKGIRDVKITPDGKPEELCGYPSKPTEDDNCDKPDGKFPIDLGNGLRFCRNGNYKYKDQTIPRADITDFLKKKDMHVPITDKDLPLAMFIGTDGVDNAPTDHDEVYPDLDKGPFDYDATDKIPAKMPLDLGPLDLGHDICFIGKDRYLVGDKVIPKDEIVDYCTSKGITDIPFTPDCYPDLNKGQFDYVTTDKVPAKMPLDLGHGICFVGKDKYLDGDKVIPKDKIVDYCKSKGITDIAFTPDCYPDLGKGPFDYDATDKIPAKLPLDLVPLDLGHDICFIGKDRYLVGDKVIPKDEIVDYCTSKGITDIPFTPDCYPDLNKGQFDYVPTDKVPAKMPLDLGHGICFVGKDKYLDGDKVIPKDKIVDYCKSKGITDIAFTPDCYPDLGKGPFDYDATDKIPAKLPLYLVPLDLGHDICFIGKDRYLVGDKVIPKDEIVDYCTSKGITDIPFTPDCYPDLNKGQFDYVPTDKVPAKMPLDLGHGICFVGKDKYLDGDKVIPKDKIVDYCKSKGITDIAFTPDCYPDVKGLTDDNPKYLGHGIFYLGNNEFLYQDHVISKKYMSGFLKIIQCHDIYLPEGDSEDYNFLDNHFPLDLGYGILDWGNGTYECRNRYIPEIHFTDLLKIMCLKIDSGSPLKIVKDAKGEKCDKNDEEISSSIDKLLDESQDNTDDNTTKDECDDDQDNKDKTKGNGDDCEDEKHANKNEKDKNKDKKEKAKGISDLIPNKDDDCKDEKQTNGNVKDKKKDKKDKAKSIKDLISNKDDDCEDEKQTNGNVKDKKKDKKDKAKSIKDLISNKDDDCEDKKQTNMNEKDKNKDKKMTDKSDDCEDEKDKKKDKKEKAKGIKDLIPNKDDDCKDEKQTNGNVKDKKKDKKDKAKSIKDLISNKDDDCEDEKQTNGNVKDKKKDKKDKARSIKDLISNKDDDCEDEKQTNMNEKDKNKDKKDKNKDKKMTDKSDDCEDEKNKKKDKKEKAKGIKDLIPNEDDDCEEGKQTNKNENDKKKDKKDKAKGIKDLIPNEDDDCEDEKQTNRNVKDKKKDKKMTDKSDDCEDEMNKKKDKKGKAKGIKDLIPNEDDDCEEGKQTNKNENDKKKDKKDKAKGIKDLIPNEDDDCENEKQTNRNVKDKKKDKKDKNKDKKMTDKSDDCEDEKNKKKDKKDISKNKNDKSDECEHEKYTNNDEQNKTKDKLKDKLKDKVGITKVIPGKTTGKPKDELDKIDDKSKGITPAGKDNNKNECDDDKENDKPKSKKENKDDEDESDCSDNSSTLETSKHISSTKTSTSKTEETKRKASKETKENVDSLKQKLGKLKSKKTGGDGRDSTDIGSEDCQDETSSNQSSKETNKEVDSLKEKVEKLKQSKTSKSEGGDNSSSCEEDTESKDKNIDLIKKVSQSQSKIKDVKKGTKSNDESCDEESSEHKKKTSDSQDKTKISEVNTDLLKKVDKYHDSLSKKKDIKKGTGSDDEGCDEESSENKNNNSDGKDKTKISEGNTDLLKKVGKYHDSLSKKKDIKKGTGSDDDEGCDEESSGIKTKNLDSKDETKKSDKNTDLLKKVGKYHHSLSKKKDIKKGTGSDDDEGCDEESSGIKTKNSDSKDETKKSGRNTDLLKKVGKYHDSLSKRKETKKGTGSDDDEGCEEESSENEAKKSGGNTDLLKKVGKYHDSLSKRKETKKGTGSDDVEGCDEESSETKNSQTHKSGGNYESYEENSYTYNQSNSSSTSTEMTYRR